MAHFAKLGEGNIVERVEVVSNDIATTEQTGIDFLKSLYGNDTVWKQTSYNGNLRKHFAGKDYYYYENLDAFVSPKPFESWILNNETCTWECPVEYPTDGQKYYWNENLRNWTLGSE